MSTLTTEPTLTAADARARQHGHVALSPAKRLAYAVLTAAAIAGVAVTGSPWFVGLWFLPDLALLSSPGALAGGVLDRRAIRTYNAVHHLPTALVATAVAFVVPPALPFALTWLSHIALDRAVGYGPRALDGFQRGY